MRPGSTGAVFSSPKETRQLTPLQRKNEVYSAILIFLPVYHFEKVDPLLILAQSVHETQNFTSPLVVNYNNAFGMKQPTQRPTTSQGPTSNNYATYATLADSVEDYFMRAREFGMPNTEDPVEFVNATVESDYAEDPNYVNAWTNWFVQLSDSPGLDTGGANVSTNDGPGIDNDPPPNDGDNVLTNNGGPNVGGDNDMPDFEDPEEPKKDPPWLFLLLAVVVLSSKN